MSKETNKQAAEKLFAATSHDVLFANPEGEFFTSENLGNLSLKPGQKLEKFERPKEKASEEVEYEFNAKDTVAKIKEVTSIEDLKAYETDARKSVKEAYDKKLAELTASIEVDGNDETENQE